MKIKMIMVLLILVLLSGCSINNSICNDWKLRLNKNLDNLNAEYLIIEQARIEFENKNFFSKMFSSSDYINEKAYNWNIKRDRFNAEVDRYNMRCGR